MRGTIIMWSGEKGVVVSSGRRFNFDINQWLGEVAPKPDMAVDLTLTDGVLEKLSPVEVTDVARERLGQIGGHTSRIAQEIYEVAGKDVIIGYGVFAVCALFLPFISIKLFGIRTDNSVNLPGVLNGLGNDGGGMGWFLVLLAICSVIAPVFWKHRNAPLAFCVPLLVTLYADFKLYNVYSAAREQIGSLFGEQAGNQLSSAITPFGLGIGAYATLIVAAYIALRGVQRYSRNSTRNPAAARPVIQGIFQDAGKDVVIGYGLFAVGAFFFPFVAEKGDSLTLADTLHLVSRSGGGMGLFLLLLAFCSLVIPYFWKHRYAPLSFCVPLLVTLYAGFKVYRIYSATREQMSFIFGQVSAPAVTFGLGIGAYVTLIVSAYIALRGIRRYRRHQITLPLAL